MTIFTPELFLICLALIMLLVDAFAPRLPKRYLGMLGALGVACAFYMTAKGVVPGNFWASFSGMYPGTFLSKLIILISTLLTLIMLIDFKPVLCRFVTGDARNQDGTGELYILPLFAAAGMMWMCSSTNFIALFVALELTTLSFYVMVGYLRRNVGSLEGGVKYLITGALSAGLLIFGIAWLYGNTGTFALGQPLMEAIAEAGGFTPSICFALALILLGLAFKIGAVPMQVWVPDVYQGAPTPITAFLSVASKTAGLCVLFTFLMPLLNSKMPSYFGLVIMLMAAATLIVGNLGAIGQTNVKRLLGYSSIGHAGYILPMFLGASYIGNGQQTPTYLVYMLCYLPMTFGAFYVLSLIRTQVGSEGLDAFRGLGKRNPRLAAVATLMFASLAGVPLTGGFTAKLFSFFIMASGQMWILLGISIVAAGAGFYYYFKPIRAMYWEKADEGTPSLKVPILTGVMLTVLSIMVLASGSIIFFLG